MTAMSLLQQTQHAEQPREMSKSESTLGSAEPVSEMEWSGFRSEMHSVGAVAAPYPLHSVPAGSLHAMPRKMQSTRLSEIRWDALANGREQRRVLNLRGLPSKLSTADALRAWLRAEGLGHAVEDLKVLPGKAGRLSCAVLRAREAADVERLAKFFHGRQCGAGSPIAVSFAAPGGLRGSAHPRATPAKVQSSLDAEKQPASPCLVPGTSTLDQSVPDLAMVFADLGVLEDSRPFYDNNIQLIDTASSLAALQSVRSFSSDSEASSSAADSNCGDDCTFEAGQLQPPPGLEGWRGQ